MGHCDELSRLQPWDYQYFGNLLFVGLAIAMLYLSSILIGRRHWVGSPSENPNILTLQSGCGHSGHCFCGYSIFRNNDVVRIDATAEQLSSLSEGSIDLLGKLQSPVEIDAFISPSDSSPNSMSRPALTCLLPGEIDRGTKLVSVNIHVITPEDNASATAEKYGVENQNGATPPLL